MAMDDSMAFMGQMECDHLSIQQQLQNQIESGDELLKDHFSAGRINAQYHSPKIQNDLIAAVGKMDSTKTNPRNQSRKIFHSCADEGTDVANKEQLPLIIRFVDQSGMIREEFLEFVLCDTGTSGQAIADKIKFRIIDCMIYY